MNKKLISFVVPAYREEKNIPLFYDEFKKTFVNLQEKYDYELIFVNDWSPDKTWEEILKLCKIDENVKGINLSRNFWKEIALSAWVENAAWDAVVTTDADWQRPMHIIKTFILNWEDWNEIVYWVRKQMNRNFFRKILSGIFNKLMTKISEVEFESWVTDFMLIDRKVVNYFTKYCDKNRIFRWIILSLGFSKQKVYFVEPPRKHWSTQWQISKLFKLATDSVTSFSIFPLKFIWYLWIFIVFFSFWLLTFMTISRFFMGNPYWITNSAFFIISNVFLSGITLSWLWIIALYIAKIHSEVLWRPLYIVDKKVNFKE